MASKNPKTSHSALHADSKLLSESALASGEALNKIDGGYFREIYLEVFKEKLVDYSDSVNSGPCEKYSVAERMADAIVGIYIAKGACFPEDLLAKGFTCDEIKRYWALAHAFADIELKIMIS